jgi:integrase
VLPTDARPAQHEPWALYVEVTMADKRITVWVQRFPDRANLMLQWIDPDTGKRKSKSAETADEGQAEQKRSDLEYELNNGLHKEASRMGWEKFRELFEAEYLPNLRPSTQKCYREVLDAFEKHCAPNQLKAITERTISAFVSQLRQVPLRAGKVGTEPYTIHVRLRFLHGVLKWGADQNLIPKCPRFPTVKYPKRKPQPVPAESFEKLLLKATDPQMQAFLLCGWLAGLRLAEAFSLEWVQTDEAPYVVLDRNRIVLPAGFVKAVEDQWVPMDPVLRQALEALPRRGKKVFRFTDGRATSPDHPAIDRLVGVDAVAQRIVRLAKEAGVKMTMKSLRRGFGCRYAGKVSAHVLQRLMRHSDIRITMDYYANIDAAVEEAVLGPQRNSSRNTTSSTTPVTETPTDVTPCQNGSGAQSGGLGWPNQ